MNIESKTRKYDIISMDVACPCNARCVFCFNNWEKARAGKITPEQFLRIRELMPMAEDQSFYLSCLFEPTLNPDFGKILKMIPKEYKEKVFFTSNFVRHLSDEELKDIASANLTHLNISLETFQPELYDELTGTKQSHFYDNVDRLIPIAREYGLKIRFITMILSSNIDELPELVKTAHDKYAPYQHELRTPYFFEGDDKRIARMEQELLGRKDIDAVVERIQALGYDNLLFDTTLDKEMYFEQKEQSKKASMKKEQQIDATGLPSKQKNGTNESKFERPSDYDCSYLLRIDADGVGHLDEFNEKFYIDKIDDLPSYFQKELERVQATESDHYFASTAGLVKKNIIQRLLHKNEIDPFAPLQGAGEYKDFVLTRTQKVAASYLDVSKLYDNRYLILQGWEDFTSASTSEFLRKYILVEGNKGCALFHAPAIERKDVCQVLNREELEQCGFKTVIDLDKVGSVDSLVVWIGYQNGQEIVFGRLDV